MWPLMDLHKLRKQFFAGRVQQERRSSVLGTTGHRTDCMPDKSTRQLGRENDGCLGGLHFSRTEPADGSRCSFFAD